MPLVDLLAREAALLLHQVDEAEIAGAEDDDLPVGDVVFRPLLLVRLLRPPGRLPDREPDHLVLLVPTRDARHVPSFEGALHELVEPVAVSLLEGRALRLAV